MAHLDAALRRRISGARLQHVYGVVEASRALSARFGAPAEKAEVAALMHDYCKWMPAQDLLAIARRDGLMVDPAEESHPHLLHGPVAAAVLRGEGLVTDPEILDAIRWHTTGRPGMSLLERVIWLADYIEPGRDFPGVEPVRQLAETDLDGALLLALDQTIAYVKAQGWPLHAYSVKARYWLAALRQ